MGRRTPPTFDQLAERERKFPGSVSGGIQMTAKQGIIKIEGQYSEADWYGEVRVNGKLLSAVRSQRLYNHSPDGFAWGYSGSGPAQLALAVLLEVGLRNDDALALYQSFKREYIAPIPRETFCIEVDIAAWVVKQTLGKVGGVI